MPELAKFARQRLSQNAAPETHPDAGLLTGFLQNALPPQLRSEVTEHLGYCAACRGILRLALPQQQPETVPQLVLARPRQQAWSILRWASVAATTAVVAGTVWLAQAPKALVGSSNSVEPAKVASATAPVQPQLAQPETPSVTAPVSTRRVVARRQALPPVELARSESHELLPSREMIQTGVDLSETSTVTNFDSRAANMIPPQAPAPAKESSLKWTVNPTTGLVYQSTDGLRWQSVNIRRGTAFKSVVPAGNVVWASGNEGLLFRSSDNGQNWEQVAPWGNASAGDIVQIRFSTPQNGSVKTTTGTWSTTDGGQTWKKQ